MKYSDKLNVIADKLKKSKKVNSLDRPNESESETLAHAFLDIDESCRILTNELFPKLEFASLSEEEINELLLDIGEELRHILYHIKDPKFYGYLGESI